MALDIRSSSLTVNGKKYSTSSVGPAAQELIGHDRTEAQICEAIGADRLIFQDLEDLEEAVRRGNLRLQRLDSSCFTGEYVTGDIDRSYLDLLEQQRSDDAKHQQSK